MTVNDFDPSSRLRPTAWSGLVVVAASALLSALASGAVGDSVRIRWSVGTYYGPEYAPAALVLAAFPVAAAVAYLGFRLLARRLERTAGFEDARDVYELCALATLGAVVLVQVALLAANLT
jgi:hypothetical protein